MDTSVEIDELRAELNRHLPTEQQIHKDDPLFTGIVLNRVALSYHVRFIHKKIEEAVNQMAAVSEQHTARSAAMSERMIANAGNHIERQVDAEARQWEERLRTAGADGEACIRRACWLAWAGGTMICICACVIIGAYLGNFVFFLVRPENSCSVSTHVLKGRCKNEYSQHSSK